MPFQGRGKRVHPLRGRDKVFERFRRLDVVDAEWNDVDPLVDRPLHFALDLPGVVGALGKDQDHDPAGLDRIDDRFAPVRTWNDVARRHPATNRLRLQPRHDGVRDKLVFDRVTYENVMSHNELRPPASGPVTLKLSSRNFRFKANRISPGEISGALLRLVLIRDSFHARLANAVEIQRPSAQCLLATGLAAELTNERIFVSAQKRATLQDSDH